MDYQQMGYSTPIFTKDATDWQYKPLQMMTGGEGGDTYEQKSWYSPSLNAQSYYDPATGMDQNGLYQRYTPEWYDQTNGAGSYDAAVQQYAPQIGTQDPAKFFQNLWLNGDATASAQGDASAGMLDKFMTGISSNLNPLTGTLAVLSGGLAGGAFGAMGAGGAAGMGAGAEAFGSWMPGMVGGADFAGLSALEAGIGGATGGATGLGGSMFDFGDMSGIFNGNEWGLSPMDSPGIGSGSGGFGELTDAGLNADWGLADGLDVGVPGAGTGPGGTTGPNFSGSGFSLPNMPNGTSTLLQNLLKGLAQPTGSGTGGNLDINKLIQGILSGGVSIANQRSMEDKYTGLRDTINANQFPFKDFQDMAYKFKDPQQRYQMMLDNPGYQASRDYVTKAQARRNAQTGDIKSGYGDSILADVIGKNAQNWDAQNFDQTKAMSGMGFNNAPSQALLAQIIPQIYKGRQDTAVDVGKTLNDSNLIPWLLGTVFGGEKP